MICNDPELALRDKAVSLLYDRGGRDFGFPPGYVHLQRQWLARRNRCSTFDCIIRTYDARVSRLALIATADEELQHSDYSKRLGLTALNEQWKIFSLLTSRGPINDPHIISLVGLVRIVDGAGRWISASGCVVNFRQAGDAWRVMQSHSCKVASQNVCFTGTYLNSSDWLDKNRPRETESCHEAITSSAMVRRVEAEP